LGTHAILGLDLSARSVSAFLSSVPLLTRVDAVCGRDRLVHRAIATSVRLLVGTRRHPVRLGGVPDSGSGVAAANHRHGVSASAVGARAASWPTTAFGTSVRSYVDTDLSSVEPGGLVSNRVGTTSGHPLGNVLLDVVHLGDGFLRLLLVGVSHKPEAPAAASVAVLDNNLASC
jgi:hypothetical protein